jgi:hypothetical protein
VDTLHRRLAKLEVSAREEQGQRWRAALQALSASLSQEHARLIRDWIVTRDVLSVRCGIGHADTRFCLRCVEAADPPAIVRAMWVLTFAYVEHGTPVALPPEVAQIYLDRPEARAQTPCCDCGYLLPTCNGRLASDGPCPGCAVVTEGRW